MVKKPDQEKDVSPEKGSSAPSPAPANSGDVHPYSRGSAIEVIHGVKEKRENWSWWMDSEDEEEEHSQTTSVRLCDVIDRVSLGNDMWRYYVHYRDFNRRMDEWVGMERIVSPPSVGNAKVRMLKKEEEKKKRKQILEEQSRKEATEAALASQSRASRRARADLLDTPETTETPRMTRRQRRRTTDDDNNTVVMSNMDKSPGDENSPFRKNSPFPDSIETKEVVKILTHTAAKETTFGEHIVATIPAHELDEHEGLDEASLREHEEVTKIKNVANMELGEYRMETWYFSPLPKELLSENGFIETLYVCEFSLNLFARKRELLRFQAREFSKNRRHPPGNEIYRCGKLSMFEVDGFEERIYCQNLCYIAKLFLDHKTLYFDVDPFLFYVLCEVDNQGFHPVGYYSKEKYSDVGYNLACILTFPSHQRKGYGRFLIAFSYELSKKEEKVGSPEKPMSDLGQQAYKPYWNSTIIDFLMNPSVDATSMSIMDISKKTSIMAEDIVFTLNQLGLLKIINGVYFIAAERTLLERLAMKHPVKEPKVDASKLHWTPFLTDVKRDKFSVHSKKPSVDGIEDTRASGGFP
jgi:histone acetyltransferase MYST1